MAGSPKVSIVIPVYNGSDYLREAIDSALAQSYGNVEVIVVNDGSDDGGRTEEIARSYGERIRYFRKENGGVASALNLGIREMGGEYFSWLSHDDVYLPGKVETQLRRLSGGPDVVLYGDYELMDAESNRIGVNRIPPIDPRRFRHALVTSYPIHGCTALVPKACLDVMGGFEEGRRTTQDYAMWFRMARRIDFVHIPELLIRSRIHPKQGSLAMDAGEEKNAFFIECLDALFVEWMPDAPGEGKAEFFVRAAVSLKRRNFLEAAEHAVGLSRSSAGVLRRWTSPRWTGRQAYYRLYDVMRAYRKLRRRIPRSTDRSAPS